MALVADPCIRRDPCFSACRTGTGHDFAICQGVAEPVDITAISIANHMAFRVQTLRPARLATAPRRSSPPSVCLQLGCTGHESIWPPALQGKTHKDPVKNAQPAQTVEVVIDRLR